MECNRDDAIRSREVAETKFAMQDFLGAKKFMLKAQQLYPPLEGAAQMLAVLDVHIAAQVKVGANESDLYGILQVEPVSDDSTIKRQYRKLALLLHPDKNPAKGAEAAFKLIGEAFAVLSDKTKRYLHDSKRGAGLRVAQTASPASEPWRPAKAAYPAQYQTAPAQATPTGAQAPHPALAFWTACPVCLVRYQYMRIYLGYQLLCQKCHTQFLANDINVPAGPVPLVSRRAEKFNFQTWSQNGGAAAGSVPANGHARAPGGARATGAGSTPARGTAGAGASAAAAAAANLVQRERVAAEKAELKRRAKGKDENVRQEEREAIKKAREDAKAQEALHRLKKKRVEAIEKEARRKPAMKTGTRRRLEKRKRDDEDEDEEDLERSNSGSGRQADITRKSSRRRRSVTYGLDGELSDDDDFEVLPGAKNSRATTEFAEDRRQNASKASRDTHSVQHVGISSVSDGGVEKKKDEVNVAGEEENPEGESGEEHLAVPDSDFHDFDADRTEGHVKKSQVWAVFDETDGFPRFYCQINEVTLTPFFVEGVWLESIHPQKDNLHWLKDRELSIGTGQFRLGDDFQFDSIHTFAHLMTFKKNKNVYEVYPKRLEVWAMYADYDQEVSNKDAEGNLKLRYDFVLIRSDFTAHSGQGRVVKLQKLKGYKTLWVPHGDDYTLTVTLDLHKFSHRVPALTVTEKDVQGVPCECLELDPASTPADVVLN